MALLEQILDQYYLEEAAIYGTKHGIADTKEFLQKR